MAVTVVIDAGHGGSDPGAVYNGRREKDEALRLAQAVGTILEDNGVNVVYTRTTDVYDTPFAKAMKANDAKADYFISIHRNSSEEPNNYNGISTLIFDDSGIKAQLARNINEQLERVGFNNLGVDERPNLVVLKRTGMPAVLVEAGFINSDRDNKIFDEQFEDVARAIADGVLMTINRSDGVSQQDVTATADIVGNVDNNTAIDINEGENDDEDMRNDCCKYKLYRVQTGAFRNQDNADRMLKSLLDENFPAFIVYDDGLYKVQVGAYRYLDNAVKMEQRLRRMRFNTYITT